MMIKILKLSSSTMETEMQIRASAGSQRIRIIFLSDVRSVVFLEYLGNFD